MTLGQWLAENVLTLTGIATIAGGGFFVVKALNARTQQRREAAGADARLRREQIDAINGFSIGIREVNKRLYAVEQELKKVVTQANANTNDLIWLKKEYDGRRPSIKPQYDRRRSR